MDGVTYIFDGSFDGLMCCCYESMLKKEIPAAVADENEPQLSMFFGRYIASEADKAAKMARGIGRRFSPEALGMLKVAYLAGCSAVYTAAVNFVRLGFEHGPAAMDMLSDDSVNTIFCTCRRVMNEAHHYKGFLRFAKYDGGVLIAEIEPKSFVLPLIANHFADRFNTENFMIYDEVHGAALLHEAYGDARIVYAAEISLPDKTEDEKNYENLWRVFYNTIGIEGRRNAKLLNSSLPKRFRPRMTEFAK